jgi:hypothetical protein
MITFELINRKRKPIKRYAFIGILIGILTIVLIGILGQRLDNTVKIVLMILVAFTFIICLFILNYSIKAKNVIGNISFLEESIELEILQKKEIIQKANIKAIRFKFAGYEGLNDSTIIENLAWFPSFFSYHSGMNNFVYIYSDRGTRTFEFYIPNKRDWIKIKRMGKFYHDNFETIT